MAIRILSGDCRAVLPTLPDESVHCVVTSPPYWGLRDYGVAGQIGLEPNYQDYVTALVDVFREVRRVLRRDGTLWLNLGDSYAATQSSNGGYSTKSTLVGFTNANTKGRVANDSHKPTKRERGDLKPKDLCGIPWRVAFALQADGWWLRQDIIWSKPNPMPESVTDRCTKAHEYIFLLSKSERYYYDQDAIREPHARLWNETNGGSWSYGLGDAQRVAERGAAGTHSGPYPLPNPNGRNKRSVWEVATQPLSEAHFATFPPALIEPCIKAGCPPNGTVLDPFGGAGTTGLVADRLQRNAILIELNPQYAAMSERRITDDAPLFVAIAAE